MFRASLRWYLSSFSYMMHGHTYIKGNINFVMNHVANAGSLDHVLSNCKMTRGQFWDGRDLFEITFRNLPGGKEENYNSEIHTRNSKRASSEYKPVTSDWTKSWVRRNVGRVEANKSLIGADYTERFITFSVITNIYNKKTKGPTLMELFTATGKLKKFFFFDN